MALDDALRDLAEAVLGSDPSVFWSNDEAVAKREADPLFTRCAQGKISPERAILVFMINMRTRREAGLRAITESIDRVLIHLTEDEERQCEAFGEFSEFFMQIANEADYILNNGIARDELIPLFQACANGTLTKEEAQDAVFDIMNARKTMIIQLLGGITKRLVKQIVDAKETMETEEQ